MTSKPQTLGLTIAALAVAACRLLVASGAAQAPPLSPPPSPLRDLQAEVIAKLSGHSDIRPGVALADRASLENRKAVRTYLSDVLRRMGLQPMIQTYGTDGENVFAVLPCGRPGAEAVVLGAHYDSVRNSPGANDDASGVAAVVAVAGDLVRATARRRDVIVVFFDEEERGLRGSRAFAQRLKDDGRPVHSVHTVDQMGWDRDGDRAIELELPYEGALAAYQQAAASLGMNVTIQVTSEPGSDHSAFRRLGYQAVGITEEYRNRDTTPHIHRPGDTYETINFDYLASTTRLITEVMRGLVR